MGDQLSLFEGASPPAAQVTAIEPRIEEQDRETAARLPRFIRFGTSSWSFPGWARVLWEPSATLTEESLARAGLYAYARHPLFRTVGIDRSYYGPLRADDVATYAAQIDAAHAAAPSLPPFRFVSKVWDEITTAVFPRHPRYGARAGQPNPHFLDANRFLSEVLEPYRAFAAHAGAFVFELTPMPRGALDEVSLTQAIDGFLSRLPGGFRWAFELRNEELLGARWFDVLRAHGAAHVFTYWTAMPSIRAQLAHAGAISSRFVVARLMLPPFARYDEKKAAFAPFDRIVAPQPDMHDDVLALLRAAAEHGCDDAFVVVNNKAEGSAPLTVRALAARAARELGSA
ncbi:MAG: DUF72 domain-containing protein [Labilithrix sp.]|nr:DUF72 domain-containing protein [Labilithrix sp.]